MDELKADGRIVGWILDVVKTTSRSIVSTSISGRDKDRGSRIRTLLCLIDGVS